MPGIFFLAFFLASFFRCFRCELFAIRDGINYLRKQLRSD
jgi:hypothetical protein